MGSEMCIRDRSFGADRFLIGMIDSIANVAGWEPYNLHDLGHVFLGRPVLRRSCTTSQDGRIEPTTTDDDLMQIVSYRTCGL